MGGKVSFRNTFRISSAKLLNSEHLQQLLSSQGYVFLSGAEESSDLVFEQSTGQIYWRVSVIDNTTGTPLLMNIDAESGDVTQIADNSRSYRDLNQLPVPQDKLTISAALTISRSSVGGSVAGTFEFDEMDEPGASTTTTPLDDAFVEIEWKEEINPPKGGSGSKTCEAPATCTTYTDSNGDFSFSSLDNGVYTLTALPETEWSKPNNTNSLDEYSFDFEINNSSETEDIQWTDDISDSSRNHFGNLAHSMEEMHDYLAASPFSYSGWNSKMGFSTAGSGLSFECIATAYGTSLLIGEKIQQSKEIIYHEYIHNVVNDIYGGWIETGNDDDSEARALDEAIPDFFAAALANDSDLGEDVSCLVRLGADRDIDNTLDMDDWIEDEYYNNSLIVSGAIWDLTPGEPYATSGTSLDEVAEGVWEALQATPTTYNDLGLEIEDYFLGAHIPTAQNVASSWDNREMPITGHKSGLEENGMVDDTIDSQLKIEGFPSPARAGQSINVSINVPHASRVVVSVFDILGREIMSYDFNASGKGQWYKIIETEKLASGIYFVVAESGSVFDQSSFIINR